MVKIRKGMFGFFLCFLTGTISGLLLGVSGLSVLLSYRIDEYHKRMTQLETIIEEKNVRLEKFEDSINKDKFILKDIDVILRYDGDELDKLTIEKNVKEYYRNLLGKEVRNVDTDMAVEIINNRMFKYNGKQFRYKLTRLVLSDILKLWVDVKEETEDTGRIVY